MKELKKMLSEMTPEEKFKYALGLVGTVEDLVCDYARDVMHLDCEASLYYESDCCEEPSEDNPYYDYDEEHDCYGMNTTQYDELRDSCMYRSLRGLSDDELDRVIERYTDYYSYIEFLLSGYAGCEWELCNYMDELYPFEFNEFMKSVEICCINDSYFNKFMEEDFEEYE